MISDTKFVLIKIILRLIDCLKILKLSYFNRKTKAIIRKSNKQRSYECRIRKKLYLQSIEEKVKKLEIENSELKEQIITLKQTLSKKTNVGIYYQSYF